MRGSHSYSQGGIYTITMMLRDDDGDATAVTTTAYVSGVRLDKGVLQIVGTGGNDRVQVKARKDNIKVQTNFTQPKKEYFAATNVAAMHIVLGGGNDRLQIHKKVDQPATIKTGPGKDHIHSGGGPAVVYAGPGNDCIHGGDADDILHGGGGNDHIRGNNGNDRLFGEAGNDHLHGNRGDDILVGGDGKDKLHGGRGNDLVIGGRGADDVQGKCGSDILIGGFTSYDTNPTALDAAFDKWLGTSDDYLYLLSVQRISRPTGSVDDDPFLAPAVTVFDDQSADKLKGGFGRDVFFADLDGEGDEDDLLKGRKTKKHQEYLFNLLELVT